LSGDRLVDFHHEILTNKLVSEIELFDLSSWIDRNGHDAVEYYKKFLVFFICHGILFETFMITGGEEKFTKEVFLPAKKLVEDKFKCSPIILPVIPIEELDDKYWWCYGNDVKIK
jgi:hypothetical protein